MSPPFVSNLVLFGDRVISAIAAVRIVSVAGSNRISLRSYFVSPFFDHYREFFRAFSLHYARIRRPFLIKCTVSSALSFVFAYMLIFALIPRSFARFRPVLL